MAQAHTWIYTAAVGVASPHIINSVHLYRLKVYHFLLGMSIFFCGFFKLFLFFYRSEKVRLQVSIVPPRTDFFRQDNAVILRPHIFPFSGETTRKEVETLILSYIRTIFLYLVLIMVIRLMGKRQIGEMEPSEFVVTMLVANLAAIPMQDGGIPLYSGLVPILTVLGVELILSSLALKSVRLRRILCGKPVILIENGRILQNNLRKTRVTMDELTEHLREKDVLDLRVVQYAILETNGNLSVFPYPENQPASAKDAGIQVKPIAMPITIIEDGYLFDKNLPLAKKDMAWVQKTLREHHATVSNTWLLTVDDKNKVYWIGKETES